MVMRDVVLVSAVGFVLYFAALWCFILWGISRTCGWRRLAERFGDTSSFHGEITRFCSARIGFANYTGALRVGATDLGLYLAPMRFFRPFHPPLLIPWTEVEADAREARTWRGLRLAFPSVRRVSVVFYGRAVARVLPYLRRPFVASELVSEGS